MLQNIQISGLGIRLVVLLCVGLFVGIVVTSAQQFKIDFDHLTTEEGLSMGTVSCTFKDSRGFIWIGTWDGLNRYNAYEIEVFKHDPQDSSSLGGNIINAIAEDVQGNIWVGTRNNGISIFNYKTGKFTQLRHVPGDHSSLGANHTRVILRDSQDRILVGTSGGGLNIYDGKGSFKRILHNLNDPYSLSSDFVFSIIEDSPGKYWVGCNSGSLDLFDLTTNMVTRYVYDENYQLNANRKPITKDARGQIWIGTDGEGIRIFDPGNGSFQSIMHQGDDSHGLNAGIITFIHAFSDGEIWIGTDGGGINVYDPFKQEFSYIMNNIIDPKSLSSNAVYDLFEDDAGAIWISTFRGGVNYYSPSKAKFQRLTQIPFENNSLSFSSVISVAEASNGKIWLGTDGGGLDLFDPRNGSFEHFKNNISDENSISGNVIKCIYEDCEGILWLGTYAAGLTRFDPATNSFQRFYHQPANHNSIGGNSVWCIIEDDDNYLWFGILGGGMDRFDRETGKFKHYKHDPKDLSSVSSNVLKTFFIDSHNNFWVGTEDGGVNLFDAASGTFQRFGFDPNKKGDLPNSDARTIMEDSKGNILVGTLDGLSVFNRSSQSFLIHPTNDVLPSKVINGVLEDDQGYLWIATNLGLSRYDPSQGSVLNFDKSDGIQGNEFNYTASIKTYAGKMVFGGTQGFNMFTPNEIQLSEISPAVVLTEFSLFGEEIASGDSIGGRIIMDKPLNEMQHYVLKHHENVFSLKFAALDYTTPERIKYAYQLEGFDKDWISTNANQRMATYTNLEPGEYNFKVRGTNSDGIFSSDVKSIRFTILPPWWRTWWFRISSGVFVGLIVFGAYQWRVRALKQQRLYLSEQVANRTKDLEHMIRIIGTNSKQIANTGTNLKAKSGQLANDAQTQDVAANSIVEAIENVTHHTKLNEQNALVTNDISENTVKQLEHIRKATLNNIQEIKAINSKINVLEEIFRQTNILAINASIEAARAGAYGTGFSVIAAEVRKLAEKSKEASTEIVNLAQKGVAETEQVGALILDFIPEVEKSASLINQISESSKEQTSSIEHVNHSLRSFFNISKKNTTVSGEIFTISSELDGLANFLNNKVMQLQESVD